MLMTGVDSHRAGVPDIPMSIPPEFTDKKNYQGVLSHKVVTVATLLKDAGYHTYMTGKWHLGYTLKGQLPDLVPSKRGFERTIALMESGGDNWEQKTYVSAYKDATWYADGEPLKLPDDFYSSKYFIDKPLNLSNPTGRTTSPFSPTSLSRRFIFRCRPRGSTPTNIWGDTIWDGRNCGSNDCRV